MSKTINRLRGPKPRFIDPALIASRDKQRHLENYLDSIHQQLNPGQWFAFELDEKIKLVQATSVLNKRMIHRGHSPLMMRKENLYDITRSLESEISQHMKQQRINNELLDLIKDNTIPDDCEAINCYQDIQTILNDNSHDRAGITFVILKALQCLGHIYYLDS